jgi:hypothetical protein
LNFIAIEKHGGWEYAAIVVNEDGSVRVFDSLKEAHKVADELQDGIVVGDEQIDIDGDDAAFIDEFRKNVQVLQEYVNTKEVEVPKEFKKAISNLAKLKSQIL